MPFHHLQINSGTLTALSCDYGAFGALGKGSPPTTSGDIKLIAFGNEEQIDKCAESLSLRRFGLTEHGGKATKCGQQQAVEWSTSPYLCRKSEMVPSPFPFETDHMSRIGSDHLLRAALSDQQDGYMSQQVWPSPANQQDRKSEIFEGTPSTKTKGYRPSP